MDQRISLITLGSQNLTKAREFYQSLGWVEHEQSSDKVVFFQLKNGLVLGLYGWKDLAEDAGVPHDGNGFRGTALAYNVSSKEQVQPVIDAAILAGGKQVKRAQDVFWGGYSGYFSDLDGHLWEVAYNPFATLTEDGRFSIGEAFE
ncbi:MAG: VOC family protein [Alphaproteobacteria bacterium]|nr:VOC family protein [Alphaproteobacteria bacterium]